MNRLFILFMVFSFLEVSSQITIYENDISSIGDVVFQRAETPTPTLSVGSSGASQIWDFSTLSVGDSDSLLFINPSNTIYANQYPNSNLCLDDNGTLSYYNKTSNGLFILGLGDTVFQSPALFLPLPLTYGLNISDGPIVVIDTALTGPFIEAAIPSSTVSVLTNGLSNRADTALVKITNTTDFSVDAYGTMTTPLGTFDVLRVKMITYTDSELDVYCSDTVSGQGSWVTNVPFSSIPILANFSNNEVEYKYQWITNDPTVSFLICEAVVDMSDNIIDEVSYQIIPTPTNVLEYNEEVCKVFPNPSSDFLTVQVLDNEFFVVYILDGNGKLIVKESGCSKTEIDISRYSSGNYYINIQLQDIMMTKKVVIN